MVPVEVRVGSFRRDHYDPQANKVNHCLYLDMIEEIREDSLPFSCFRTFRTNRRFNIILICWCIIISR